MNNAYFSLLKTAWKYAGNKRQSVVTAYVLLGLSNVCLALNPVFLGWFLNNLQKDGMNSLRHTWLYVAAYMVLYFIHYTFHGPARILERNAAFAISKNMLDDLYEKLLHLPIEWHRKNHTGVVLNRIKKATFGIRDFFQNGFSYLRIIITFSTSFFAILFYAPVFGILAISICCFSVLLIVLFDRHYVKSLNDVNEKEHAVVSNLTDSLANILTVITLRLGKQTKGEITDRFNAMYPPFRRNIFVNEWKWLTAGTLIHIIYALLVVAYVYNNFDYTKVIYVGGLVTLIGFINQLTTAFYSLAYQYNQVVQYHTDVKSVDVIIQDYSVIVTTKKYESIRDGWKEIQINNLTFSYNSDKNSKRSELSTAQLRHLDFTIMKGRKTALIGASGSGKSTLMAAIKGLFPGKTDASVLVDRKHVHAIEAVGDLVTLFPQEPEIFENTIRYNITLGLTYTDREVDEACRISTFDEVLITFQQGLDSMVYENGTNLSGGQKQRLALARGILAARSTDILLLDEPTSSVDHEIEARIYKGLFEYFHDKAIVSSLHRLYLTSMFDHVVVLDKGEVVVQGTPESVKKDFKAAT